MNIYSRIHARCQMALKLGLLLALVFSLAGCANLPFFTPQEPVTLRFTYLEGSADYAPLVEEFSRQNRNITIELDPVSLSGNPGRTLLEKAKTADIIRIPSINVNPEVAAAFLPLDSLVSTDQTFKPDDMFPGSLEGLRIAGKQVGVPAGLNPMVFFYNADKFAARGVRPPPTDWVMDEFLRAAVEINNADPALIGSPELTYGFCTHPQLPDAVILSFVFGGGIFDSVTNPTRATLNSPENVAMLNWYASLKNDFGVVPDLGRAENLWALVNQGSCGFWMDWLDRSTFGPTPQFTTEALPLPAYATPFTVAFLDSYSIMAASPHPEESWKWISFLLSQPTASGRLVPPLITRVMDETFASQVNPQALAVARALPPQTAILGLEMYRDPRLGPAMELFSAATFRVMAGEMDAQTALDAVQEQADQAFQR